MGCCSQNLQSSSSSSLRLLISLEFDLTSDAAALKVMDAGLSHEHLKAACALVTDIPGVNRHQNLIFLIVGRCLLLFTSQKCFEGSCPQHGQSQPIQSDHITQRGWVFDSVRLATIYYWIYIMVIKTQVRQAWLTLSLCVYVVVVVVLGSLSTLSEPMSCVGLCIFCFSKH